MTTFTLPEVLTILRNMGHDTDCGACMMSAFHGSNGGGHTCGKVEELIVTVTTKPTTTLLDDDFPPDDWEPTAEEWKLLDGPDIDPDKHMGGEREFTSKYAQGFEEALDILDVEAEERLVMVLAEQEAGDERCNVPPPGWRCTRKPDHDGPCAALAEPDSARHATVEP